MDSPVFSREKLKELLQQEYTNPFVPMNRAPYDAAGAAAIAQQQFAKLQHEARERTHQLEAVKAFKKSYIKIRTDNIVLDHHTAIELTKMIHSEADTLTFEDTQ